MKENPARSYIHANYVDGHDTPKRYICTQGPLDKTVEDFWRMVWQEKSVIVVMLTKVVEQGKVKCASYFPEDVGEQTLAGPFKIKTDGKNTEWISTSGCQKVTLRDMVIVYGGKERHITHVQHADWPDRGTPNEASPSICLLARVHQEQVSHFHPFTDKTLTTNV